MFIISPKPTKSRLRNTSYQLKAIRHFNKRVKLMKFNVGDLALRKVFNHTKPKRTGAMGPNWEDPYKIIEIVRPDVYHLETTDGARVKNAWNAKHLRKYYK